MVFRVHKNNNYTTMSNYHLRDKRLSFKAKGLLSMMLSLPANWNYSISGIVSISKESETSVKSTLNELKDNGYLEVVKLMPDKTKSGRIEYEYNIFETPKQEGGFLGVEFLGVENQAVENVGQLNTNNKITNKLNTNNKKNKKYFDNEDLNELFIDFLDLRKKIKAVNSDRAINNLLNILNKYNDDTKKEMINNSITNSWKGVYPLKKQQQKTSQEKMDEVFERFMSE